MSGDTHPNNGPLFDARNGQAQQIGPRNIMHNYFCECAAVAAPIGTTPAARAPAQLWTKLHRSHLIIAAALALGFGAFAVVFPTDQDELPAPPPPSSPPVPQYRSGVVQALDDKRGIDLDAGALKDQDAPGVDISPYTRASHLGAMDTEVTFTVLPTPGPAEPARCAQAEGWTRYLPTLYELAAGRNLCVRTDEGRLSMLTVEKPATTTTGTIGFRYLTWDRT